MRRSNSTVAVGLAITLLVAACGGGSQNGAANGDGTSDDVVAITGTDGLAFEPAALTVPAGKVTVELTSEPSAPHTFTIEEPGDVEVVRAQGGQTATGTIDLEPGTYTFYCSIPGHRQAGMEGTLTVQ